MVWTPSLARRLAFLGPTPVSLTTGESKPSPLTGSLAGGGGTGRFALGMGWGGGSGACGGGWGGGGTGALILACIFSSRALRASTDERSEYRLSIETISLIQALSCSVRADLRALSPQ